MAITLHDKYAKQIQEKFIKESVIAGRLSTEYSWAGVKTVKVSTPTTVAMGDYSRTATSNRYGTPVEIQDTVQELGLTQDKCFSLTIDKGNNEDQSGIKAAGKMLALQLQEQAIPTLDEYVLGVLAKKAGTVASSSTSLTKSTVSTTIDTGLAALDDAEVPDEGRTIFVSSNIYMLLKQAGQFDVTSDSVSRDAWVKGQVGTYSGCTVVKVPSGRWPVYVNFIIVQKNAATAPVKLNDTKVHQDPPGISGNLLEGRQYYDCFVFGAKSGGVYVHVDTSGSHGTVLAAPTVAIEAHTCTITPTASCTAVYTTDGTDPRYSNTATTYSAPFTTEANDVVKAYQYLTAGTAGTYPSAIGTDTDE